MIDPYQAIGLVPTMRGIRHRDEIKVNIEHISHLIKAASWLSSLDLPVRLIAIPEGALQGFNDEVLDLDHESFAAECAIDVPGPETDALGALARQWNAFVMGQAKARHPEFPGRFFNVGFVLDPAGDIVLRDREHHGDRLQLCNHRQASHVGGVHNVPRIHYAQADTAADGCSDATLT